MYVCMYVLYVCLSLFLFSTFIYTRMSISCCFFLYFEFNYKLTFERKQLYPLLSRLFILTDTHTHTHAFIHKHINSHMHQTRKNKIKEREMQYRKKTLENNCGVLFTILSFQFYSQKVFFSVVVVVLFVNIYGCFYSKFKWIFPHFYDALKFIDEIIALFNFFSIK